MVEIVGYVLCTLCDEPELRVVAGRTGGVCTRCHRGGHGPDMRRIEVVGRGYRIRIPNRRPTHRTKVRRRDKDHHTVNKAKERALRRLKAIFPDLYDCLLAEERARAGLDPWPVEAAIRHSWDPDSSLSIRFAEVYHALDRGGS